MELFRALAIAAEPPQHETMRLLALLGVDGVITRADYTDLFVLQLPPYASVYLGAEGMLGGEARDRIAGFWRALGETAPTEPDHLAVILAVYAHLAEQDDAARGPRARAAAHRARSAFLWEHMVSWLPAYLTKVRDIASRPYAAWACLLQTALLREARTLGPPTGLPLHLRSAPPMPAAGDDLRELLASLLIPVQSGLIFTRADLRRASQTHGIGLRAGERLFTLTQLVLGHPEVLPWLEREANAWRVRHERMDPVLAPITAHWASRATAAARAVTAFRHALR